MKTAAFSVEETGYPFADESVAESWELPSDKRRFIGKRHVGRIFDAQVTPITFIDQRQPWLLPAHKSLENISRLKANWDGEGAARPSKLAIESTRNALSILADVGLAPASIDASLEGGVCVSFVEGMLYADIEFFNSGNILAVTSNGGEGTQVWQVEFAQQSLSSAVREIQRFLSR